MLGIDEAKKILEVATKAVPVGIGLDEPFSNEDTNKYFVGMLNLIIQNTAPDTFGVISGVLPSITKPELPNNLAKLIPKMPSLPSIARGLDLPDIGNLF